MRNLADLQKEAANLGLEVIPKGKKLGKEDYEVALRNHYWLAKHDSLESMLPQIEPQFAKNIKDLTEDEASVAWRSSRMIAQEKLDGFRFINFILGSGNRFTARRKSDKTYLYMERTDNLPFHTPLFFPQLHGTILDGEMKANVAVIETESVRTVTELQATVAMMNGRPELSKTLQTTYGAPTFHVFDILVHNGRSILHLPYEDRLAILDSVMTEIEKQDPEHKLYKRVVTVTQNKKEFYDQMVAAGNEGIMLKSIDSTYQPGKRNWDWLKVKRFEEVDAVITGFVPSDQDAGWAHLIGAVEVSCIDERDGQLRPIAAFGAMPMEWRERMTIQDPNGQPTLNPEYLNKVVVIRGQEWTKNIRLKHAVAVPYGGWPNPFRDDKAPEACTFNFEKVEAKIEAGERI